MTDAGTRKGRRQAETTRGQRRATSPYGSIRGENPEGRSPDVAAGRNKPATAAEEETVEDVRNVEDGTERAWDARDAEPSESKAPWEWTPLFVPRWGKEPQGRCPALGGDGRAVTRETLQGK